MQTKETELDLTKSKQFIFGCKIKKKDGRGLNWRKVYTKHYIPGM